MVNKELTASQRAFHANLEDPRHGTQNGYVNLRCRCDRCRAANTDYCRELKAARASRIVPERLHGTVNAYSNYRCRCSQCRAAYNESRRTGRSRSLHTRELAEKMYEDYRSGMSINMFVPEEDLVPTSELLDSAAHMIGLFNRDNVATALMSQLRTRAEQFKAVENTT